MPDVEFRSLDDYEGFIRTTIEPWSPTRLNPAPHTDARLRESSVRFDDGHRGRWPAADADRWARSPKLK